MMGPKIKYLVDTCSNRTVINGVECIVFVPNSLDLIMETIAWDTLGMIIAEAEDRTPFDCSKRVRAEVQKYFGVK